MINHRKTRARSWAALAKQAPWSITPAQAEALETISQTFCVKRGATAMGIHPKTFEAHLGRARRRMDAYNTMAAALMWDRWRRPSQQRDLGLPADLEPFEDAPAASDPFAQLRGHVVPPIGVHATAKG